MAQVLIIDDEEMMCQMLSDLVMRQEHEATCAYTLAEGLRLAALRDFDLVFLDVGLPDGNGLEVIPTLRSLPDPPEIIIITGSGDADGAELAITQGAWDYIEKTSSISQMVLPLTRALQFREEKQAHKQPVALKLEGLLGGSPPMQACLDLLAQAAAGEVNVLITGATGTGKELFARAIHLNSSRAAKNFVVVDCAALPENLVESALFGYEKGAFTGADKASTGLIAQAHGGTLFLDEVGELPGSMQKAFLRVLQERSFRPIGGKREVESDFRLVAATNRNLEEMVNQGGFRQDLFFRLRSLVINLPSLKERNGDLVDLAWYHTARLCKRYGLAPKGFSPELLQYLSAHDWPGNVRELVNALDTAMAAAHREPTLFPQHLPAYLRTKLARASVLGKRNPAKGWQDEVSPGRALARLDEVRKTVVAEVEKRYLQDLVQQVRGNIQAACRLSGLSRARLYSLLKLHGISLSLAANQPSSPETP
ncbi:MAG: Fis family transcriptional regulator [Deltaproteobacteria bacterium RBG_13_60_28]|nr:MAG: Fis family transcriptional regulator [Deltaproteobacteria bacterium RBG_13_60_28]